MFVCRLLPKTCLRCLFSLSPAHLCLTSPSLPDSCDSNTTRRVKRKPRTEKKKPLSRDCRTVSRAAVNAAVTLPGTCQRLTRLRCSNARPPFLSCFLRLLLAEKDVFHTCLPLTESQRSGSPSRGPGQPPLSPSWLLIVDQRPEADPRTLMQQLRMTHYGDSRDGHTLYLVSAVIRLAKVQDLDASPPC